jgi:heptosyltransferase-1
MRLLVIKTSSFGDILQTLPALSDAARALPGLEADWLVEEAFAELPAWHPCVAETIPIATRRWRRAPLAALRDLPSWLHRLRGHRYDLVLDAQGLLKSAFFASLARGPVAGFDRSSSREAIASLFYGRHYAADRGLHAVERQRRLFAAALGYEKPSGLPESGLRIEPEQAAAPYIVFCSEASWPSKLWPTGYWQELARRAAAAGWAIRLPLAGEAQRARAGMIASIDPSIRIHPTPRLADLARLLVGARAVVAADSGPAHLAAALGRPQIVLYGPTSAARHGTAGSHQIHLEVSFGCAPCYGHHCRYREPSAVTPACYGSLMPDRVWASLEPLLEHGALRREPDA